MKVAHLSHNDEGSGAGRAAFRIHTSLRSAGVISNLYVGHKRTEDSDVHEVGGLYKTRLWQKINEYREARFARSISRDNQVFLSHAKASYFQPHKLQAIRDSDIVCAYWLNGGFVSPEELGKIRRPVVWRLSDFWPFTGGCHFPAGCDAFIEGCCSCPQLKHPKPEDNSRALIRRKCNAWQGLNLTLVAPSTWIGERARSSFLFRERRVETIPTGVDLEAFKPVDQESARRCLGIPVEKKVILFGAFDPIRDYRKGYNQLLEALETLAHSELSNDIIAITFGAHQEDIIKYPLPSIHLGRLDTNENLKFAYNAADLIAVPSLEDNLPNVALEALACGTPIIGYSIGGMPDVVKHRETGFLGDPDDHGVLGRMIFSCLSDDNLLASMRVASRLHAEKHFSLQRQVSSYISLFQELLDAEEISKK